MVGGGKILERAWGGSTVYVDGTGTLRDEEQGRCICMSKSCTAIHEALDRTQRCMGCLRL